MFPMQFGGMAPMGVGFGPQMFGMMMGMQLMQMMQMLMMMMGQMGMGANPGACGNFDPMQMMGNQMGMGGFPGANGMPPFPFGGFPGGGCPNFGGGFQPPFPGGNFGPMQANPNCQIPQCGPNPNKQQINQMIEAAAAKYGVPPEILKAVAYKESGWNPNARGDGGASFGMFQIYTRAHPDYNAGEGMRNPAYNIEYAARFLSRLYRQTGNWREAVRRYNGSGPMAERYANHVMSLTQSQPWHRFGV